MAAPLKDKIQVFFFGLMLGLLIGACFFVFKLDGYFRELSFYKSNAKKNIVKEIIKGETEENKSLKKKNTKSENKNPVKNVKAVVSDTIVKEGSAYVSTFKADSLKNDSVFTGSPEEIVVKKDELIASKTIDLQIINSAEPLENESDTLLNKLSDIRKDPIVSSFKIEYWMSPLNYRGYKLLKNKVLLYGINPAENIRLYKVDGVLFCKNSSLVYRFDYSPEFRYFEIVTDELLLAKLK